MLSFVIVTIVANTIVIILIDVWINCFILKAKNNFILSLLLLTK